MSSEPIPAGPQPTEQEATPVGQAPELPPDSAHIGEPVDEQHGGPGARRTAPTWPFAIYGGIWLVFSAFIIWRFIGVSADTALYELETYRWVVLVGVLLTAWGPLVAVVVWLALLGRHDIAKGDLFASALFKAAIVTFAGVCLWWGSLLLLDQLRIGSLL